MNSQGSIRFKLVLYGTTLLAITTATVSILGYRTAHLNLETRRTLGRQLLDRQYNDRRQELVESLDNELLSQAQTLATIVQLHPDWARIQYHNLTLLGVLGHQENVQFTLPVWFSQVGQRGPMSQQILRRISPVIRIDTERLQNQGAFPVIAQYYQISSTFGSTTLSSSLNGVPIDPNLNRFAPDRALYWEADETQLADGKKVRRVRLKTAGQRFTFFPSGPRRNEPGRGGGRPGPERGPTPPAGPTGSPPALYIECASDLERLEARITDLQTKRDEEMAARDAEADEDLATLKKELATVWLASFLAASMGLWALMRQGMSPVKRLSEAVSRINPGNFVLEVEENHIPAELRPIASRLKETLAQLGRAFNREKQATADISHELRTPLATLLTTCDLALRKTRSLEEYKEFLAECRIAGLQMNRAVDRLLTLARLDAGVDVMCKKPVDLNGLVRSCVHSVENLAEAAGIRLIFDGAPVEPLQTDPDKLGEVVLNLLHNGIQYNRSGGSVTVRTRQRGDHAEISDIDTGIGIRPEDRELIFERFYRVDPSRTSDGMNSGLGLSIVKGFVDLMGGAIQVESTVGTGSTFRLLIPLGKKETVSQKVKA